MAADTVDVYTHSWDGATESLKWSSDGSTGYSIDEVDNAERGAKIVMNLGGNEEFATEVV